MLVIKKWNILICFFLFIYKRKIGYMLVNNNINNSKSMEAASKYSMTSGNTEDRTSGDSISVCIVA